MCAATPAALHCADGESGGLVHERHTADCDNFAHSLDRYWQILKSDERCRAESIANVGRFKVWIPPKCNSVHPDSLRCYGDSSFSRNQAESIPLWKKNMFTVHLLHRLHHGNMSGCFHLNFCINCWNHWGYCCFQLKVHGHRPTPSGGRGCPFLEGQSVQRHTALRRCNSFISCFNNTPFWNRCKSELKKTILAHKDTPLIFQVQDSGPT